MKRSESFNSLPQKPKNTLIDKPEGVLGKLTIPFGAANSDEFIESLGQRTGLSSIKEPAAKEWLKIFISI